MARYNNRAYSACSYGIADESPHQSTDISDYNESAYFNFLDGGQDIGGIVRVGNRPAEGYREFSVNLKLPGGAIALLAARQVGDGAIGFSCGGLALSLEEPTRRWRLSFRGSLSVVGTPERLVNHPGQILKSSPLEPCEIELEWLAASPMFVLNADGSGRPTPGGTSLMGSDHYEQFGTVSGQIRLGSRAWILADAPSMRDHTWGPRVWGTFHGEWLCAFLPGGTGMTLFSEMEGTGKRVCSGAVLFEGKVHYVERFDVATTYDGGAEHELRHCSVVRAAGLPTMALDGVIDHFAPLTMGTGEHRTRLASMTVTFVGGHGGTAFAEFLRPLAGIKNA